MSSDKMDHSGEEDNLLIEFLPEEVLLKIFSFLNEKELKNSTLVCKQWSELIGQSSSLMIKLPLRFNGSNWPTGQWIQEATKDFKRKYHTIKISYFQDWNKTTLKVFQKLGVNLRKLEINECFFRKVHSQFLNNLFSSMDKLEEFRCKSAVLSTRSDHFWISDRMVETFKDLKAQNLPKLKTIVMEFCDLPIFELFKSTKLTSLTLTRMRESIDFLAGQEDLEELTLSFIEAEFFEATFAIIFKNLLKLKTLEVDITRAPSMNFKVFPSNFAVVELTILYIDRIGKNFPIIVALLSKLPNLETLVMQTDEECLQFSVALNQLKKLKKLKLIRRSGKVWLQQVFSQ